MDHAPVVQVLLDDKVVAEVPFSGSVLRVGRMRDNDLVLPNLSVSRFHAVLHRDGNTLRVEDLGSENGCLLNGERVESTAPFGPGDELRIVRHVLRLRSEESDPDAELPGLRSDAGSVAQASLDTAPLRAVAPPPLPNETVVDLAEAPVGLVAAAEGDADLEPPDRSEPEEAAPPGALFDFSRDADLGRSDPVLALQVDPPATAPAPPRASGPPRLYAGLIVQREGRLQHVAAWEGERICAGRSSSCEIPLGSPQVSRRHALFVREGDRFEVRDLDSVGGVFVNGERVLSHELAVGDVIRIDDFELTFLLDQQPVGEAVRTPSREDGEELPDAGAPTQLGEAGQLTDDPTMPPRGMAGVSAAEVREAAMAELDLVDEVETGGAGDDEKELEVAVSSQPALPAPIAIAGEQQAEEALVMEMRIDARGLPEPVRRWLADQEGVLRVPVEIRLRREDPADQ